jgi:hypothetical protein
MATRSLPTKPDRDAAVEPLRGKGPTKGKRPPAAKSMRGKMVLKPSVKASTKQAARKAPVRKAAGKRGQQEPPDQQRARTRGRPAEQYVRLRVQVEDGELSIIDGRLVDGPLAQTTAFQGSHAYEVTDGDRLLHAGSIPDLGVVRSFAHPKGTLEQHRHHSYELSTYEFAARVPAEALKDAAASKIAVVLYRVKEREPAAAMPVPTLAAAPLGTQRARELREVGRVVGLPASVLPSALSKKAVRAKGKRTTAKKPAAKRRSARR